MVNREDSKNFSNTLMKQQLLKLFGSKNKLISKIKNREQMLCLEVVEVVLVQHNLVDNKYQ